MQLGTRWTSGGDPPAAVPEKLRAQIAIIDTSTQGDPSLPRPRWTLTWLEGRPIAHLDTGVIVTLDASGDAVVSHDEDDEFA